MHLLVNILEFIATGVFVILAIGFLDAYWSASTRCLLLLPAFWIHAISAGVPLLFVGAALIWLFVGETQNEILFWFVMTAAVIYLNQVKTYALSEVEKISSPDESVFNARIETAAREGWSVLASNAHVKRPVYRCFLLRQKGAALAAALRTELQDQSEGEADKVMAEPAQVSRDIVDENKKTESALQSCREWLGEFSYLESTDLGMGLVLVGWILVSAFQIWSLGLLKMSWFWFAFYYGPVALALPILVVDGIRVHARKRRSPQVKWSVPDEPVRTGTNLRGELQLLNATEPLEVTLTLSCIRRTAELRGPAPVLGESVIWYRQFRGACAVEAPLAFEIPVPRQAPATERFFEHGRGHSFRWLLHLNSRDPRRWVTREKKLVVEAGAEIEAAEQSPLEPSNVAANNHPACAPLSFLPGDGDDEISSCQKAEKPPQTIAPTLIIAGAAIGLAAMHFVDFSMFWTTVMVWMLCLVCLLIEWVTFAEEPTVWFSNAGIEVKRGGANSATRSRHQRARLHINGSDSSITRYGVKLLEDEKEIHEFSLSSPVDSLIVARALNRQLARFQPVDPFPLGLALQHGAGIRTDEVLDLGKQAASLIKELEH